MLSFVTCLEAFRAQLDVIIAKEPARRLAARFGALLNVGKTRRVHMFDASD